MPVQEVAVYATGSTSRVGLIEVFDVSESNAVADDAVNRFDNALYRAVRRLRL